MDGVYRWLTTHEYQAGCHVDFDLLGPCLLLVCLSCLILLPWIE